MSNLIHNIQRWVESTFTPLRKERKVEVLQQYIIQSSPLRRRRRSILVKRIPRPYWEERGWLKKGGKYTGGFQTRFGNWAGYVTVSPSGRVEVFIHNPPAVLERHHHWPCFLKRNDGWYSIHATKRIADVSAGIINVEKTITEAYEN